MEKYVNEKVNSENVYSAKLKCIFKRLWYCKNDTQQRNWPVYEDEDIINGYMDELLSLLLNTDQVYLENEICLHNCENVHLLIAYFQMETRRSLRLKLMDTFIRYVLSLFAVQKVLITKDYLVLSRSSSASLPTFFSPPFCPLNWRLKCKTTFLTRSAGSRRPLSSR